MVDRREQKYFGNIEVWIGTLHSTFTIQEREILECVWWVQRVVSNYLCPSVSISPVISGPHLCCLSLSDHTEWRPEFAQSGPGEQRDQTVSMFSSQTHPSLRLPFSDQQPFQHLHTAHPGSQATLYLRSHFDPTAECSNFQTFIHLAGHKGTTLSI